MNYVPLLVGLLAALVLAIAFAGGALLGHWLTGRRRYEEGNAAGYSAGYAAMKAEHEKYRLDNRVALRAIQNLTPDAPIATLGPPPARTFDTSGGFDCHVVTNRGKQAVGRGRTLEDARASATRVLERGPQWREVVITKPGENGERVEVERLVRRGGGGAPVIHRPGESLTILEEDRRAPASAELPHEEGERA